MNTTQHSGIVSYYIAISLDGYLARKDDTVDWLSRFDQEFETPFAYKKYYETVDAVISGKRTYEIARKFEENPYADKALYLVTHNSQYFSPHPNYRIITDPFEDVILNLKKAYLNRIWVLGGGEIASQLFAKELIDEIIVAIIPYMLGNGIPWIKPSLIENEWLLKGMWSTIHGVVQLQYVRINYNI